MTKIIQVDSFSGLGGGQKVMFDIINELKTRFRFVVVAPQGLFLKKYFRMGITIHELKEKNFIRIVKELRDFIKKEKPEILHLHGTRAATWARLAIIGIRVKPKIIYTLHGFHIVRRNLLVRLILLFLEKFLNRWVDALVCVSKADKKLVLRYRTICSDKIKLIRNEIDLVKFQINPELVERTKEKLELKNNFILTTICRLHPPKDFSPILNALKIILTKIENAKLLIIGDGPLRESLEKEIEKLGLNQYVRFLGVREDISVLINLSDIVILSTKWEGLPLVPLEAGACKKPIVASNVNGVQETVLNGETGYLFTPGSAEELTDKILKLYQEEKLRKEVGRNAYQFVLKNFRKDRVVQEYQNLYQSIL